MKVKASIDAFNCGTSMAPGIELEVYDLLFPSPASRARTIAWARRHQETYTIRMCRHSSYNTAPGMILSIISSRSILQLRYARSLAMKELFWSSSKAQHVPTQSSMLPGM
jgi:hypothetical protein